MYDSRRFLIYITTLGSKPLCHLVSYLRGFIQSETLTLWYWHRVDYQSQIWDSVKQQCSGEFLLGKVMQLEEGRPLKTSLFSLVLMTFCTASNYIYIIINWSSTVLLKTPQHRFFFLKKKVQCNIYLENQNYYQSNFHPCLNDVH